MRWLDDNRFVLTGALASKRQAELEKGGEQPIAVLLDTRRGSWRIRLMPNGSFVFGSSTEKTWTDRGTWSVLKLNEDDVALTLNWPDDEEVKHHRLSLKSGVYQGYNEHWKVDPVDVVSGVVISATADFPPVMPSVAELRHGADRLNGHRYKLFTSGVTYTEAVEYCRSLGGYVARIESKAEDDFLRDLLRDCHLRYCWIDGSDAELEDEWKLSNGELMTYGQEGDQPPWFGKQPDNFNHEDQICLSRNHKWMWLDSDKTRRFGFVCEWDN